MPRKELNSEDLGPIEQRAPLRPDATEPEGDVILVDNIDDRSYFEQLAFMEDPVTIRLHPSSEKNAPKSLPVWVNGKPAEVFQRGRWEEIGYLPVARQMIVKRKVVEVILRAKVDSVTTRHEDDGVQVQNFADRNTSPLQSFTIIEDKNPRGHAWASEMMRRNL